MPNEFDKSDAYEEVLVVVEEVLDKLGITLDETTIDIGSGVTYKLKKPPEGVTVDKLQCEIDDALGNAGYLRRNVPESDKGYEFWLGKKCEVAEGTVCVKAMRGRDLYKEYAALVVVSPVRKDDNLSYVSE